MEFFPTSLLFVAVILAIFFIVIARRKPKPEQQRDKIAEMLAVLELSEPQVSHADSVTMAAPKLLTKPEWFYDSNAPLVIEQHATDYFANHFYAGRQVLRNGTGVIEVKIKNPALFNSLPSNYRPTAFDVLVLAANNGGAFWNAEVLDQAGRALPVVPKTTSGPVRQENRFSQTFRMGIAVQRSQGSSIYCVGELQTSVEHGEYLTVRVTVERKGANYNTRYGYYMTPMFSIGGGWVIQ